LMEAADTWLDVPARKLSAEKGGQS
jgi:hypothetical protein